MQAKYWIREHQYDIFKISMLDEIRDLTKNDIAPKT